MSSIGDVKNLVTIGGNSFEERRDAIVSSKYAAAELVATGQAEVKAVSDRLGLSPTFVQYYADKLQELGAEKFITSLAQDEETAQKGLQAFLKKLLDDFKKAVGGN